MGGRGGKGTAHAGVVETTTPIVAPPAPASTASASAVDAKTAAVNQRFERVITSTIEQVLQRSHLGATEWVGMPEIRAALDARGVSRATQDRQLKRLLSERKIHLAPESNRKALTKADHAAAVQIGISSDPLDREMHLIALNRTAR